MSTETSDEKQARIDSIFIVHELACANSESIWTLKRDIKVLMERIDKLEKKI